MKFEELSYLVETLQRESGTLIPYIEVIKCKWRLENNVLEWDYLGDGEYNYSAEVREHIEKVGDCVIVNADIGTGESVTFYLNAKREMK